MSATRKRGPASVPAQVARGVALLDEKIPGWALRLPRLSRLAIQSGKNCVLGQLFGYVWDGPQHLGIKCEDLEEYGFAEWRRPHQREITEAWRTVIIERRASALAEAAP